MIDHAQRQVKLGDAGVEHERRQDGAAPPGVRAAARARTSARPERAGRARRRVPAAALPPAARTAGAGAPSPRRSRPAPAGRARGSWLARQVPAQHEAVEEQADHVLGASQVAAADRGSHREVPLARCMPGSSAYSPASRTAKERAALAAANDRSMAATRESSHRYRRRPSSDASSRAGDPRQADLGRRPSQRGPPVVELGAQRLFWRAPLLPRSRRTGGPGGRGRARRRPRTAPPGRRAGSRWSARRRRCVRHSRSRCRRAAAARAARASSGPAEVERLRAASRRRHAASASRWTGSRPTGRPRGSALAPSSTMRRPGTPCDSGKAVRSVSWRSVRARSAAASASASSGPVTRKASATVVDRSAGPAGGP